MESGLFIRGGGRVVNTVFAILMYKVAWVQALEVAGQVAGTSVSNSPLPFNTMASHCEALGTDMRKKLSTWLTHENHYAKAVADSELPFNKMSGQDGPVQGALLPMDPWLALRLPPASPFDNFLRAARN